jgi:hypothetical protein
MRIAWLMLLAVPALFAGDDTEALARHLRGSAEAFEKSTASLSEAQWTFKAAPDRWSIAECAEHIAATEDALRGLIEKNILSKPPKEGDIVPDRAQDEKVLKFITSREGKAKAPEMLQPKHIYPTRDATLAHFTENRVSTMKIAGRDDLRRYSMKNQLLGDMDAHQWMLYLSGHTLRHVAQIEEVKASAGYPK